MSKPVAWLCTAAAVRGHPTSSVSTTTESSSLSCSGVSLSAAASQCVLLLPRGGDGTSAENAPDDDNSQEPTTPRKRRSSRKKHETSRSSPVVEEILRQDNYYSILGISSDAQPPAIAKAYRRRCVLTHPDKTGGDRRAFDKVAEAYDVLSDETKKPIYDRYGKKGLEQQHVGGFSRSPEDLFRSFFGSANPFMASAQRNRSVKYQLEVTLEELYQGITRTVHVSPPTTPFMASSHHHHHTKRVQVHIPKGARHGQSIVLSGEMDFQDNQVPGDVIFILHQRPHAVFTRQGYDLALTVRIKLQEAITGVQRTIRHLDGKDVVMASARHSSNDPILIQNGDVQVLKGRGMPKDEVGTSFGDLYVVFEVELPRRKASAQESSLTSDERDELGRLLDKLEGTTTQSKPQVDPSSSPQVLKPAVMSDFGRGSGQPQSPNEEEEDSPFPGFGTQRQFSFSSPFFGASPNFDFADDENVQCRQM